MEKIMEKRKKWINKSWITEYKVKWENYDNRYNSWVLESNLEKLKINEYL